MIEVHLSDNFASNKLTIYMFERRPGQIVWYDQNGRGVIQNHAEGAAVADPTPAAIIPRAGLPALLGALSTFLGAVEHPTQLLRADFVEHPTQLRADFDRLRDRHDNLVDHLMTEAVARRPRR